MKKFTHSSNRHFNWCKKIIWWCLLFGVLRLDSASLKGKPLSRQKCFWVKPVKIQATWYDQSQVCSVHHFVLHNESCARQTWHKILKNFEKSKFWTYWYWFWYWKLQFQNIDFDIDIEICISKILILILILNFLGILILILVLILKKMVKILKICVVRKTQVPLWPWVLGLIFHSFPPWVLILCLGFWVLPSHFFLDFLIFLLFWVQNNLVYFHKNDNNGLKYVTYTL